jgi:hypothetical protein
VWLSQRAIRWRLLSRNDPEILELGCGYRATQLIALEPKLKRGIGVDFQIAPELQALEKFTCHQGTIEQTLPNLAFAPCWFTLASIQVRSDCGITSSV